MTLFENCRLWIQRTVYRCFTVPWRRNTHFLYYLYHCPRPFRDAFSLLWPFPWEFNLPPPEPVEYLLEKPDFIWIRKQTEINYTALKWVSLFRMRDTSLRCLYLYETVVTDDQDEMMEESQYWFHQQKNWRLVDIPDPSDPNPVRYAILASLTETLVDTFNHKIKLGLRRGVTNNSPLRISEFALEPDPPYEVVPVRCNRVGPLSEVLKIVPGEVLGNSKGPFGKRRIVANLDL